MIFLTQRMTRPSWAWATLGLSVGFSALANDDEGWTREFRIVAMTTLNVSAQFSTHGSFAVSSAAPGAPGVGGVNHLYDDGFVRVDSTGDAGGVTSLWGYSNSSQYNAKNQTLTYHSTTATTINDETKSYESPSAGLDMAYGGKIYQLGSAKIGWELGFQWQPVGLSDNHTMAAVAQRTVHQFSTVGIVVPAAPYSGSAIGQGPVISDIATALMTENAVAGTVSGNRKLDGSLYLFRFGPTVNWALLSRLSLSLSAGGAAGLLDERYSFNESLTFADGSKSNSSGSNGSMNAVFGGYAGATLHFFVQEDADIYIGAKLMSLGHQRYGIGGHEANLNMTEGLQIMAGLHWPF